MFLYYCWVVGRRIIANIPAKIIKDKYFSGAIKNAIEQSTTEHFITVEANF